MRLVYCLLFGSLSIVSCQVETETTTSTFHLYVSNQSQIRPVVGMRVFVDDNLVVSGFFSSDDGNNWIQVPIQLAPGEHILSVEARGVQYRVFTFANEDEHWGAISYTDDVANALGKLDFHHDHEPILAQ